MIVCECVWDRERACVYNLKTADFQSHHNWVAKDVILTSIDHVMVSSVERITNVEFKIIPINPNHL